MPSLNAFLVTGWLVKKVEDWIVTKLHSQSSIPVWGESLPPDLASYCLTGLTRMKGGCFALLWYRFLIIQDVTQASYSMVLPYPWTSILHPPAFHTHAWKALPSVPMCPYLPWIFYSSKKYPGRNQILSCPLLSDIPFFKLCSLLCNLLGTWNLHVPRDLVSSIQFYMNIYFSQDSYNNIFSDECWLPFLISHISFCLEIIKNIHSNEMSLALFVGIEY